MRSEHQPLIDAGERVVTRIIRVDFHRLPVRSGSCDLAVAAFGLDPSPHPAVAIAVTETSRVPAPVGLTPLVTKSLDR